jgi:hypothetical protein
MYISVKLSLEAFKVLGESLPEYYILLPVWRHATFVRRDAGEPIAVVLSCNEKQIEAMLRIATLHYPAALPMIQTAIVHARA